MKHVLEPLRKGLILGILIISVCFHSAASICTQGVKGERAREAVVSLSGFRILVRSDFDTILTPIAQTSLRNFLSMRPYQGHPSGAEVLLQWLLDMGYMKPGSKEHLQYRLLLHNRPLSELNEVSGLVEKRPAEQDFLMRFRGLFEKTVQGEDLLVREEDGFIYVVPKESKHTLEAAIRGVNGSSQQLRGDATDFVPVEKPVEQLFHLIASRLKDFVDSNKAGELNGVNTNINVINAILILVEGFRIHREERVFSEEQYRDFVTTLFSKSAPSADGILSFQSLMKAGLDRSAERLAPKARWKHLDNAVVRNLLPQVTQELESQYITLPYYSRIKQTLTALTVWLEKRIDRIRRSQQAFPLREFPSTYTRVPRTSKVDFVDRDILNLEPKALEFVDKYLGEANPYTRGFLTDYTSAYYEAANIRNTVDVPGKKDQRNGFYGKMSAETYKVYLRVANLFTLLRGTEEAYRLFVETQPPPIRTTQESFQEMSQMVRSTAIRLGEIAGAQGEAASLRKGTDVLVTLLTMDVIGRGSNEYLDHVSQLYGLETKLSGVDFDRRYVKIMENFPIALVSYFRQNRAIRVILEHNAEVSYQANLGTLDLLEAGYGTYNALKKLVEVKSAEEGELAIQVYFIRSLMNISGAKTFDEVKSGAFLLMEPKWQGYKALRRNIQTLNQGVEPIDIYNKQLRDVARQRKWLYNKQTDNRVTIRITAILNRTNRADFDFVRELFDNFLSEKQRDVLRKFVYEPMTVWRAMYLKNSLESQLAEELGIKISELRSEHHNRITRVWLTLMTRSLEAIFESEGYNRMVQGEQITDIRFEMGSLQNWVVRAGTFSEIEQEAPKVYLAPVARPKDRSYAIKVLIN